MNYHSKSRKNWGVDQHYKDLDGNTKSFTVINHDPKLSSTLYNPTEEEMTEINNQLVEYRKELQDSILKEHPSLCPLPLQSSYTIRKGEQMLWNKKSLLDEGLSIDNLRDLHTLVLRRKELYT